MPRVTRRKPAKRGATKRGNTRKRTKQGFPYIACFIAILLIAFISYFVFAVDKPPVVQKQATKSTAKTEETLPEMPQPKWDYV
ncbi:MAG: SPOR domain-containing protein, partial [Psychromonas sp.]